MADIRSDTEGLKLDIRIVHQEPFYFSDYLGAHMYAHLDCGEILPGHRFLITGVRNDGRSDDHLHSELVGHIDGHPGEPVVAVTYEIRPGLSEQESHLYVDPGVELRPKRPVTIPATMTDVVPGSVPEERGRSAGGPVTAGAFGPFVCPKATTQILLRLQPYQVEEFTLEGQHLNPVASDLLAGVDRVTGTATLDLVEETARWAPDRRDGGA